MRYQQHEAKLAQCFSSVLMDVLDGMDCRQQCMSPAVRPLVPSMRAWGEAVTALFRAVDKVPAQPFHLEMKAVDGLKKGQILVSQCDAEALSAAWGGLLTTAAMSRQAAGVVTDGGVRDYNEIVALGFPTFSRGLSPYNSLGRMNVVEIGTAITCGGVQVRPGDLIFADVDGTVVVPQELAEEVIERAWTKVQGEDKVRQELRAGANVAEVFERYGIL